MTGAEQIWVWFSRTLNLGLTNGLAVSNDEKTKKVEAFSVTPVILMRAVEFVGWKLRLLYGKQVGLRLVLRLMCSAEF